MGVDASELLVPFAGAIQAAFSVLLTIAFGVVAAQCNLLSTNAAKEVSKLCVRMFLPALLIYKIGSNLHLDTGVRYVPILIWSIGYTLLSILLGRVLTRVFKLPSWVTPAIAFNNTTSLPLLLIESLKQTQILDVILVGGDSAADALDRAESYFLINAMVSNSLTFALGPRLLKPGDEDAPENEEDGEEDQENEGEDQGAGNGNGHGDIERGPDGLINERTSLLPQRVIKPTNRIEKKGYLKTRNWFNSLGPKSQEFVDIAWQFANAPLLGAIVGAIIGLTPALHRLFFNNSNEGGYLNAWLTTSIKNIGDLFASTQIIVVGVKLSQSMLRMKRGENSGEVSKGSLALVTLIRFVIWPLISIPIIYALASRTQLLDADPMLWFAMMLMPTGPPAMILVALTDVTGASESMKMTIAKFLTISYAITPLICFAVVGSLKATQAALGR
ncbi:auxin efflux carrier [Phaeosphaeria sp. MPI-PUGE-AT-0046c]|nr:auxin efflux carrier [Phaeosphaeria sp. MPI-PUGE-AT-0046c]